MAPRAGLDVYREEKNFFPHRDRTQNSRGRSESLYRLRCPDIQICKYYMKMLLGNSVQNQEKEISIPVIRMMQSRRMR